MTEREIGMEKLMKYVEEMQKEGINICRPRFQEYYLLEMMLISKHYGLIKRLVENDKIDLDAQAMQYAKSDLSKFFTERKDKNGMSDDYAMLLMLLSIQDEPIRFLCEILK